jgi:hypothetical protein
MPSTSKLAFFLALTSAGVFTASAAAQSFCDLVPASVVQATLGTSTTLTATPNTQGGNGCDYKGMEAGPVTITADSSDDSGIYKTIFNQRLGQLGPGGQPVSGLGDAAYYIENHSQQIAKYPNLGYTQQVLVFRAKGKIISYICMIPNSGVPKAKVLALGQLTLSKPINTLKNP